MNFTIPLRPKPCPRPRTNGFLPREYMQFKKDFGALVPWQAKNAFNGVVTLHVDFVYAKPKNGTCDVPVGDVDNLFKAVGDALQDCGVIKDDRYIVRISAIKGYGACDEIRVRIEACEPIQYGQPAPVHKQHPQSAAAAFEYL